MIQIIREYPAHKNNGCSLVIIIGVGRHRRLRAAVGVVGVETFVAMAGTDIHAEMQVVVRRLRSTCCEISRTALLLASDYTTAVTREVLYVDGGFHIEGIVFH